jgi:hypothetical protein
VTIFLICGGAFMTALGIGGLAWRAVSPRRRRRTRALGQTALLELALLVWGGLIVVGAAADALWLNLIGLVGALVVIAYQRRHAPDDLPEPLRRMNEISLNPLVQIRHPNRQWRAQRAAFGGGRRRNKAELERWFEERGL